jgi:hypothetical protein
MCEQGPRAIRASNPAQRHPGYDGTRPGAGLDERWLAPPPPRSQAEILEDGSEPSVHFAQQRMLVL